MATTFRGERLGTIMLACFMTVMAAVPSVAQDRMVEPQASRAPDVDASDEIVVEGLLEVPGANPNTTASRGRDLSGLNPQETVIANRRKYEFSERIAKCAVRARLSKISQLRAAVDGPPNGSTQVFAQQRIKQINVTCSESSALLSFSDDLLGRSIYDRGALMIEAMKAFTPNLRLTRADTDNPVVQARFNARETPRNRYRLPADYRYFEVAVCMVRLQPVLSSRLATTDLTPTQIGRFEDAIVNGARICVGDAKTVSFDPTQFRLYIADAVYRWAVAAQGVETLIPDA